MPTTAERETVQAVILQHLRDAEGEVKAGELIDAYPDIPKGSIYPELKTLWEEGRIKKTSYGHYALPGYAPKSQPNAVGENSDRVYEIKRRMVTPENDPATADPTLAPPAVRRAFAAVLEASMAAETAFLTHTLPNGSTRRLHYVPLWVAEGEPYEPDPSSLEAAIARGSAPLAE